MQGTRALDRRAGQLVFASPSPAGPVLRVQAGCSSAHVRQPQLWGPRPRGGAMLAVMPGEAARPPRTAGLLMRGAGGRAVTGRRSRRREHAASSRAEPAPGREQSCARLVKQRPPGQLFPGVVLPVRLCTGPTWLAPQGIVWWPLRSRATGCQMPDRGSSGRVRQAKWGARRLGLLGQLDVLEGPAWQRSS